MGFIQHLSVGRNDGGRGMKCKGILEKNQILIKFLMNQIFVFFGKNMGRERNRDVLRMNEWGNFKLD